jgi:hypothetical protein
MSFAFGAPAVAAAVVAISAGYLYAGDFKRYSVFTVGVFERVTHQPAALDGHECREHWCEVDSVDGERRRWFKEIVVLGVPLASYGGGEAYYCDDHAHVGIQTGEFEESRSVPDSVVWALVWVAEKFATDVETPEKSEFDGVQNGISGSVGDAMALIPVALLVLTGAMIMGAMKTEVDR